MLQAAVVAAAADDDNDDDDCVVANSRVCESETTGGVKWSKTRTGRYDLQPCPPSFTGSQWSSLLTIILHVEVFSGNSNRLSNSHYI